MRRDWHEYYFFRGVKPRGKNSSYCQFLYWQLFLCTCRLHQSLSLRRYLLHCIDISSYPLINISFSAQIDGSIGYPWSCIQPRAQINTPVLNYPARDIYRPGPYPQTTTHGQYIPRVVVVRRRGSGIS